MTNWAHSDNCRATLHSTRHNKDVGLLAAFQIHGVLETYFSRTFLGFDDPYLPEEENSNPSEDNAGHPSEEPVDTNPVR